MEEEEEEGRGLLREHLLLPPAPAATGAPS